MKLLILSVAVAAIPFSVMANDPATEEIARENEIAEAKVFFETAAARPPTDSNVREVLGFSSSKGMSATAIIQAVKLYSLTSSEDPAQQQSRILECAKVNSADAGILYACADVIHSDAIKVDIYNKIVSNQAFSSTMRLLSLQQLMSLNSFPRGSAEILFRALISQNPSDVNLAGQLYESLPKMDSKAAADAYQEVGSLLQKRK